jgi:hypothetical protein
MLRTMPGGDDRFLELERIPLRDGPSHRLAVFLAAKDAQRGGAVVREVRMDVAPDVFRPERRLHANQFAFVPGFAT